MENANIAFLDLRKFLTNRTYDVFKCDDVSSIAFNHQGQLIIGLISGDVYLYTFSVRKYQNLMLSSKTPS